MPLYQGMGFQDSGSAEEAIRKALKAERNSKCNSKQKDKQAALAATQASEEEV